MSEKIERENSAELDLSETQLKQLYSSELFQNKWKPVLILIRSMIFDTSIAISILIAYFYTVLELTQKDFLQLWYALAIVIVLAMILQVNVVWKLGKPSFALFSSIKSKEKINKQKIKEVFKTTQFLAFNLSSSGLICWSLGILFSAYWLRYQISLQPDKVAIMGIGGVLAAVGTNSFAYFRVRNLTRPYLSILGEMLGSVQLSKARPRLYKELLLVFLLLVTFTLAMTSVFYYSLNLKLLGIYKIHDFEAMYQFITHYINQTGIMIIVLCALSLALAIALASSAAKNIIDPLKKLTQMAHLIASGNLNRNFPYISNNELGMLAEEFEKMRLSLRKTIGEKDKALLELEQKNKELAIKINDLEIIDHSSRQFTSSIDYQFIINAVLNSFVQTVQVDRSSLYLFDQQKGSLILSKVFGPSPAITTIPLVNREIKWVEQRPEPLFIKNIEEEITSSEILKKWRTLWIEAQAEIAIPLFIEGKPIGFIIMGKKKDGTPFVKSEINVFKTLANQAAIAINNSRLYEQATVDSLTTLYLKRYFQNRLKEEIWRVKRYGHSLSMVMVDIDFFKQFNDKYGHLKGDKILRHVGIMIKEVSRETDIPARFGGEEFIILLPETSIEGAQRIGERLRETIATTAINDNEEGNLTVTISAGVATFDHKIDADGNTLIEKADTALYQAKKKGRNCTILYHKDTLK